MRGGLFEDLTDGMWPSDTSPPSDKVDVDSAADGDVIAQYKEVVVVGNGPSGICLSYLLSGNWPYYGDVAHPLDFLHQRLDASRHLSLVLQDLRALSDGLEGRSNNPVSILFDSLIHPDADLGVELPSCLRWTNHPDRAIDHVVLGKGLPGGAWQNMEQSALTLSLNNWMELPDLNYKSWEQEMLRENHIPPGGRQSRASVGNVAKYYKEFVRLNGLDGHFRNHCVVTSVRRITDPRQVAPSATNTSPETTLWEIRGHSGWEQAPFRYLSPHLVLATGTHDVPNRLHVPGEELPYVLHSSAQLETLIAERRLGPRSDPLLIVGAGLTAADTVIAARFYGVPVAHVFRREVDDRSLIFNRLPENMYPEYHKVHQMMRHWGAGYHGYQSYARHRVVEILPDHKVRLEGPEAGVVLRVSHVVVLIGSRPDLDFLPEGLAAGLASGEATIKVDAFTHESVNQPGLFALGPLVGDNFVRFLQGGALAVASHLVNESFGRDVPAVVEAKEVVEIDAPIASVRPRCCSIDRPSWVWRSWQDEATREAGESSDGASKDGDAEDGTPPRRWRPTPKKRQQQQHRRRLCSHSSCDRLNL